MATEATRRRANTRRLGCVRLKISAPHATDASDGRERWTRSLDNHGICSSHVFQKDAQQRSHTTSEGVA